MRWLPVGERVSGRAPRAAQLALVHVPTGEQTGGSRPGSSLSTRASLAGGGREGVVEKVTWLQGAQLIGSGRKAGAGSRARWQWDLVYSHQMWSS